MAFHGCLIGSGWMILAELQEVELIDSSHLPDMGQMAHTSLKLLVQILRYRTGYNAKAMAFQSCSIGLDLMILAELQKLNL